MPDGYSPDRAYRFLFRLPTFRAGAAPRQCAVRYFSGGFCAGKYVQPVQRDGIGSAFLALREPRPLSLSRVLGKHSDVGEFVRLLLVLVLHWSGRWLVGNASASIVIVIAIGDCICGQLSSCISQIYQTFEKMRATATFNLFINFSRLVLAVVMLAVLHHAAAKDWAIASLTVSFLATAAIVATVTLQFGWPKFVPRLFVKRMGEGFIFAVSGSTTSAYNYIDKVMLGHYGMSVANGIYSMAYRIINICAMPISSISGAALPRFFREGVHGVQNTEPFARRLLRRNIGDRNCWSRCDVRDGSTHSAYRRERFLRKRCCIALAVPDPCVPIPASKCGRRDVRSGIPEISAGHAADCRRIQFLNEFVSDPDYLWTGAAWASLATDGGLAAMNWTVLL